MMVGCIPKLSIITVVYNGDEYLEQTIKSVINQKNASYEYIILDGGSTDKSVDIIKNFSENITVWRSEPDSGIYDAMNKALRHCKGEIVNFLNCGDYYASDDVLSTVASELAKRAMPEIIYGNVRFINENGSAYLIAGKPHFSGIRHYPRIELNHQSLFYKRDLHDRFGCYNTSYKLAADYAFFIKIIKNEGVKPFYLDKVVVNFRVNGLSRSSAHLREIISINRISPLSMKVKMYFYVKLVKFYLNQISLYRSVKEVYKKWNRVT